MYRKPDRSQIIIEEFFMPFGGRLSADNRWVRMARLIPWDLVEDLYAKSFKDENPDGRPPVSARIAFGALHIKESENLTLNSQAFRYHDTKELADLFHFLGLFLNNN